MYGESHQINPLNILCDFLLIRLTLWTCCVTFSYCLFVNKWRKSQACTQLCRDFWAALPPSPSPFLPPTNKHTNTHVVNVCLFGIHKLTHCTSYMVWFVFVGYNFRMVGGRDYINLLIGSLVRQFPLPPFPCLHAVWLSPDNQRFDTLRYVTLR